MEAQIEGMVAAFQSEMKLVGFDGKKQVHTPFPEDLFLTAWDPFNEVTDEEAKAIKKKGYNCLVGLIMWSVRMCILEGKLGAHLLSRVLARPSEKACACRHT